MDQALDDLMALLGIPGKPGEEGKVAAWLRERLGALGVPRSAFAEDQAQKQSEYGGETGNLFVRFDGHGRGARRMFSTHMDTVPDCVGAIPRIEGDYIVNDAPGKALGGDNRCGCAVLLAVARALLARKGDHAPTTLVFLIQEEVGLVGARGLEVSCLGEPKPALCYNWDSGDPSGVICAIIGTERFNIEIEGVASHAGSRPDAGASAALVFARALADLDRNGLNGKIEKPEGYASANVGVLRGGQGSNVVMPNLYILAEVRAHDRAWRKKVIEKWEDAFRRAAASVKTADGQAAKVKFSPGPTYEAFALKESDPVVAHALKAVRAAGLEPRMETNNGGTDSNWINAHGIPSVTLGCGMQRVHTPHERVFLPWFHGAVKTALELV